MNEQGQVGDTRRSPEEIAHRNAELRSILNSLREAARSGQGAALQPPQGLPSSQPKTGPADHSQGATPRERLWPLVLQVINRDTSLACLLLRSAVACSCATQSMPYPPRCQPRCTSTCPDHLPTALCSVLSLTLQTLRPRRPRHSLMRKIPMLHAHCKGRKN